MRLEVAALGRQPGLARRALVGAAQRLQPLRRLNVGKDRARLAAAETAQAVQPEIEWRRHDLAESRSEVARRMSVHIADEPQRQVIVLRIDPARPRQPGAQQRQTVGDAWWNLDG